MLGVGGHLSFLIRTSTGPFWIKDSYTFEELEMWNPEQFLLPPDAALKHLPWMAIEQETVPRVTSGQKIAPEEISLDCGEKGDMYRLYDPGGQFLALCRGTGRAFSPV